MPIYQRVGGAWTNVQKVYQLVGGVWTQVQKVYQLVGGVWTLVYQASGSPPTVVAPPACTLTGFNNATCTGNSCPLSQTLTCTVNNAGSGSSAPTSITYTTNGVDPVSTDTAIANGGSVSFSVGRNLTVVFKARAFNSAGAGPSATRNFHYTWSNS
jgi:hypothetical protein